MTTEMIERLAWRISRFRLEQDGVDVSKWEPGAILAARKMALDTHRELAVAVLEEMREPTEWMTLVATGNAIAGNPYPVNYAEVWRDMIDSAKGTP